MPHLRILESGEYNSVLSQGNLRRSIHIPYIPAFTESKMRTIEWLEFAVYVAFANSSTDNSDNGNKIVQRMKYFNSLCKFEVMSHAWTWLQTTGFGQAITVIIFFRVSNMRFTPPLSPRSIFLMRPNPRRLYCGRRGGRALYKDFTFCFLCVIIVLQGRVFCILYELVTIRFTGTHGI